MKILLFEKTYRSSEIINRLELLYSHIADIDVEIYLFTSSDSKPYIPKTIIDKLSGVRFFDDYYSSLSLEYAAFELHKTFPYQRVIAFREFDLIRVARICDYLKLPGQNIEETERFRDKYVMKLAAAQLGLKVPPFAKIDNVTELMRFIDEVNYPVIVKPRKKAGGMGFATLNNPEETAQFINSVKVDMDSELEMIAEKFVEAKLVHVDGLFHQGKTIAITASEYVGAYSPTKFEENFNKSKYFGSLTIDRDSRVYQLLVEFTENLLSGFDSSNSYPFHVELWYNEKTQEVMLNEAAARMGGLMVHNLLGQLFKPNIEPQLFRYFCTNDESSLTQIKQNEKPYCFSGTIIPRFGTVDYIPESLPMTMPAYYYCDAKPGDKIQPSASFIDYLKSIFGYIVTVGESREECLQRFDLAMKEFEEKVVIS